MQLIPTRALLLPPPLPPPRTQAEINVPKRLLDATLYLVLPQVDIVSNAYHMESILQVKIFSGKLLQLFWMDR